MPAIPSFVRRLLGSKPAQKVVAPTKLSRMPPVQSTDFSLTIEPQHSSSAVATQLRLTPSSSNPRWLLREPGSTIRPTGLFGTNQLDDPRALAFLTAKQPISRDKLITRLASPLPNRSLVVEQLAMGSKPSRGIDVPLRSGMFGGGVTFRGRGSQLESPDVIRLLAEESMRRKLPAYYDPVRRVGYLQAGALPYQEALFRSKLWRSALEDRYALPGISPKAWQQLYPAATPLEHFAARVRAGTHTIPTQFAGLADWLADVGSSRRVAWERLRRPLGTTVGAVAAGKVLEQNPQWLKHTLSPAFAAEPRREP